MVMLQIAFLILAKLRLIWVEALFYLRVKVLALVVLLEFKKFLETWFLTPGTVLIIFVSFGTLQLLRVIIGASILSFG